MPQRGEFFPLPRNFEAEEETRRYTIRVVSSGRQRKQCKVYPETFAIASGFLQSSEIGCNGPKPAV
jgi:hypothetical protein